MGPRFGVNFSPDAGTLFAHIQDEGLSFAITGPFKRHLGHANPGSPRPAYRTMSSVVMPSSLWRLSPASTRHCTV